MKNYSPLKLRFVVAILCGFAASWLCTDCNAQQTTAARLRIGTQTNAIFLETGSNTIIEFSYRVPDLWIGNPDVLSAMPMASNKFLLTGLVPGVSTLTVSDPSKRMQAITVHVRHNVRSLEAAIKQHFPDSNIQVNALHQGVVLRGEMAIADQVSHLVQIAEDFFPGRIINHVTVSGSQMVAISVRIYEVSRQKLRQLGVDWSFFGDDINAVQSISGLIQEIGGGGVTGAGQSLSLGVIGDSFRIDAFLKALEQKNLAKLLDEPTLVAESGRSAEFLSGGEVPIQISTNFGGTSLEYRSFGTKLDIVPIIHGHGDMTLEVKAEVSDVASDLSGGTNSPGFRVRRVNTGVRMKAGHTLALAGDYREETESVVRGIPGLMDLPGIGKMFRDTSEQTSETELVFLITPKFISSTEHPVPVGPGMTSRNPTRQEFYNEGSLERQPGYQTGYGFSNGRHVDYSQTQYGVPQYGVQQYGAQQIGAQQYSVPQQQTYVPYSTQPQQVPNYSSYSQPSQTYDQLPQNQVPAHPFTTTQPPTPQRIQNRVAPPAELTAPARQNPMGVGAVKTESIDSEDGWQTVPGGAQTPTPSVQEVDAEKGFKLPNPFEYRRPSR